MRIWLTGGTGFIGGAVLTRLVAAGHTVTAAVRSEGAAARVEEAGATPSVGDLTDGEWVGHQLATHDGAVHTAGTGSADDEALNQTVIDGVVRVYGGTPSPYLHTGGIWLYGDGAGLDEESPDQPAELAAWRAPLERALLAQEVRATVIRPAIVYGHGGGAVVRTLLDGPRVDGALTLPGSGDQHWTTVHVADLADLYVHLLDASPGRQEYIAASGENPTVRELGEAAAGSVVPSSDDATRERLGAAFADALLLDQQASGAKAKATGWSPSRPSLVDLLRDGYPADR